MRHRVGIIAAMLVGACAPWASAQPYWPEFRGPTGDGHVAAADAERLPLEWSEEKNIAWKTPIHGRGWSSPVIWGDQIWMTTATPEGHEMFAVCVDRNNGKIVHDLKLFDIAEPEEIHAFNSYASCTPAIEEGRVYIHFGSYGTACLDITTGEKLWERRDLPCNHFRGPGSSPILVGDKLIVHYDGFDDQYLVALNKKTGETVWKKDRSHEYGADNGDFKKAFATPTIIEVHGQSQLISVASKAGFAYDPATGDEIWRVMFEQFSSSTRPVFGHGLVFLNTGFGKANLLAVRPDGKGDVTDTHVEWIGKKSIGSKPSETLIGDRLYAIQDQGVASCFDAKTGDEVWSKRLGGNYSASPIAVGDKLYVCSQEGKTTVLAAGEKFQELAENTLEKGCWASPAVADGALFLRTENALYRIQQK